MTRTLRLQTRVLLFAGLLPLALAGCPWDQPPGDTPDNAKLVAFESQADLLNYFKEQARQRTRAQRSFGPFGSGAMGWPAAAEGDLADDSGGDGADATGEQAFSTTNIQEAGVDESDVFKSDGTYFYIADGDTLRIVQADPLSALAEVGRLDLDVYASGLYLYGSRLIVLAQRYEEYEDGWARPEMMIWPPYYVGAGLTVLEVDVSDPAAPELTRQIELDGALADSRLTNDRLILVLTIAPELPEDPTPLAINMMTLDDVMPKARTRSREREMVQWEHCLHPGNPDGYFMTAVVTLDVADIETIMHSVVVIAQAGTIYASTEALYVTDSDYDASDDYREMTAIHKFAFDEDGAAQYAASGSVPGRLLNQFSLGEHADYLRAATHVSNPVFFGMFDVAPVGAADAPAAQDIQPPSDFNAVYVLGQKGGELAVTGSVENIAPNEDLHSARFLGDHGFLVTFRKIDPLFVLDLSDPADPQVVGELKVPGFSDYLHPVDDTHLIGVGRATVPTEDGFDWFQGVQISLFDVSNWSNPSAVEQITLGGRGSSSEVDRTHKGFTFLADRGLLAIPMQLYTVEDSPWVYGELEFEGVVAFQVDTATGFTELGRLATVGAGEPGDYFWYYEPDDWARAAFIGQTLYAVDPAGVAAAPLDDLEGPTAIEFAE